MKPSTGAAVRLHRNAVRDRPESLSAFKWNACPPSPEYPILECPPELGPVARQEWDRIVGELTQLGVLSSFDRGPLAAYCIAYALWIDAIEMVQKHGAMIKSPKGFPIQSPYLSTVNRQAEIMLRIASEFGFTPASRSRIFSYSKSNSLLLDAVNEPDDGSSGW